MELCASHQALLAWTMEHFSLSFTRSRHGHLTPKTCYSHCTSPSILCIVNLSLSLHYRTLSISAAPLDPQSLVRVRGLQKHSSSCQGSRRRFA